MAVRTRQELLDSVKEIIGDSADDSVLNVLEDLTDTIDDYERRVDGEDWKTKYEQNDAEWRNRYKERFFSSEADTRVEVPDMEEEEEEQATSYEDLFSVE